MDVHDVNTVEQHKNLIARNRFSEAASLLDNTSRQKGFRAAIFNTLQNKLREIQIYLLNKTAAPTNTTLSLNQLMRKWKGEPSDCSQPKTILWKERIIIMSVLSGYKRFKKYLRTGGGYKLCSEWTKSDSVEMTDGSTLQESMDTVVSDVESTQNDITDVYNELKTSLGGMTFGVDAAGRYGYIKAGADTVTPFKKNDWETLTTENIKWGTISYDLGVSGKGNGHETQYSSYTSPWSSLLLSGVPGQMIIGTTINVLASGYAGIYSVKLEDGVDGYGHKANRVIVTIKSESTAPDHVKFTLNLAVYVPS